MSILMCWSSGLVADAGDCIRGPAALPLALLVEAAAMPMPLLLLRAVPHEGEAGWVLEARRRGAGEKQWASRAHRHSKAAARIRLLFSRRSSSAAEEEGILCSIMTWPVREETMVSSFTPV